MICRCGKPLPSLSTAWRYSVDEYPYNPDWPMRVTAAGSACSAECLIATITERHPAPAPRQRADVNHQDLPTTNQEKQQIMSRINRIRVAAAAALITVGAVLVLPSAASAHHTTITCQSPGTWLIVNSEGDKTMTFTTDQGHAGSIGAGGSTTVDYSGTSLTVSGVWSNGATNTNTGTGDCTVVVTTTTDPGVHHPDCYTVKDQAPGTPTTIDGYVYAKYGNDHVPLGWMPAGSDVPLVGNGHALSHYDICFGENPNPTTTTTEPAVETTVVETTEPPVETTEPPATTDPPVETTDPPETTEPPVTTDPVETTDPPATTDPPVVTDPPATDPPATDPPATDPPVVSVSPTVTPTVGPTTPAVTDPPAPTTAPAVCIDDPATPDADECAQSLPETGAGNLWLVVVGIAALCSGLVLLSLGDRRR